MGGWRDEEWIWKWCWRGELLGREYAFWQDLNELLQGSKLVQGKQDSWRWGHDPKGTYSTKSAYIILNGNNTEPTSKQFNMLWNKNVPLKVSAFVWKALQNRIPTGDNLLKRGIVGIEVDFLCIFCGKHTETVSHLFFTCEATWAVWQASYAWWDLQAVLACEGWNHLQQHVGMLQNGILKGAWSVIWFSVIWSVWLWRNKLIFKEGNDNLVTVVDLIKLRSLNWLKAKLNEEMPKICGLRIPDKHVKEHNLSRKIVGVRFE
ncbi:hypothetical protein SLA2020_498360 [Shorea laevis]